MLLGDFDSPVHEYVRMLHISGCVVNTRLVLAAARGLIMARNRALLVDYGGSLNPDKPWAKSLLRRMGFTKRKASTSAWVAVQDFETTKKGFLERITTAVKTHSIPQALIINLDETGLKLVPVSSWTLEQQGTAKIKVAGVDDKREITGVVAASMTGDLLHIAATLILLLLIGAILRLTSQMTGMYGILVIIWPMRVLLFATLKKC